MLSLTPPPIPKTSTAHRSHLARARSSPIFAFAARLALITLIGLAAPAVVSAATTKPKLIQRVEPDYPATKRHLAEDGWVRVSFVVDPAGRVAKLKVGQSSDRAFIAPVRAALEQWVYEPAQRNGAPVTSARLNEEISIFAPLDRKLAVLLGREVFGPLTGPVVDASELQRQPALIYPVSGEFPRGSFDRLKDRPVTVSFVIRADGLPVNPSIAEDVDRIVGFRVLSALLRAQWERPTHNGGFAHVRVTTQMGLIAPDEIGFVGSAAVAAPAMLAHSVAPPVVVQHAERASAEKAYSLREIQVLPQPTHQVEPRFPADMKRRGGRGRVVVEFVVDEQGLVRDAVILSSTRPEFEQPVLDAIYQWQFRPGRLKGRPVAVKLQLPISFNIEPAK